MQLKGRNSEENADPVVYLQLLSWYTFRLLSTLPRGTYRQRNTKTTTFYCFIFNFGMQKQIKLARNSK